MSKGRKREALSGPPLDPQLRKQFGKTDLTCQRFAVGMRFFRLRQQVLFFHGSSPNHHFIGAVQESQLQSFVTGEGPLYGSLMLLRPDGTASEPHP